MVIERDGKKKLSFFRIFKKKNAIIYVCYSADRVQKCRYLRRYSTFFSESKYTNVVIDGDGKQKCSYLRRCETKYAIIYVCFCADGVRKSRYLRRYSTFFSEAKYINVVIDRDGIQKCHSLR